MAWPIGYVLSKSDVLLYLLPNRSVKGNHCVVQGEQSSLSPTPLLPWQNITFLKLKCSSITLQISLHKYLLNPSLEKDIQKHLNNSVLSLGSLKVEPRKRSWSHLWSYLRRCNRENRKSKREKTSVKKYCASCQLRFECLRAAGHFSRSWKSPSYSCPKRSLGCFCSPPGRKWLAGTVAAPMLLGCALLWEKQASQVLKMILKL